MMKAMKHPAEPKHNSSAETKVLSIESENTLQRSVPSASSPLTENFSLYPPISTTQLPEDTSIPTPKY